MEQRYEELREESDNNDLLAFDTYDELLNAIIKVFLYKIALGDNFCDFICINKKKVVTLRAIMNNSALIKNEY